MAEEVAGGEEGVFLSDAAAGPGAEFVDGLLSAPAEGAHPGADSAKGVFVAVGGCAGEDGAMAAGGRSVAGKGAGEVGLEPGPGVVLAADVDGGGVVFGLDGGGEGGFIGAPDGVIVDGAEFIGGGGGDFAFAEAEADGEPDGNEGVGIGLLEIWEGGEGAGEEGLVGGVVFGFIDFVEAFSFEEGLEVGEE